MSKKHSLQNLLSASGRGFPFLFILLIGIAAPLAAHHSFSAEYDLNKPLYMDGKITRVEWANPHVDVFVDVMDKQGKTVNWDVQLTPPYALQNEGLRRDTLMPGMDVCVEGFPEKNGKPKFGSTSVQLKTTGQVIQTPPGNWMPVGTDLGKTPFLPPATITYTGKTSCSNRG